MGACGGGQAIRMLEWSEEQVPAQCVCVGTMPLQRVCVWARCLHSVCGREKGREGVSGGSV